MPEAGAEYDLEPPHSGNLGLSEEGADDKGQSSHPWFRGHIPEASQKERGMRQELVSQDSGSLGPVRACSHLGSVHSHLSHL